MSIEKCPNCDKLIPAYRSDDPYCDCGWQFNQVVSIQDDLGWLISIISAFVVCVVQVFLLFLIHFVANFSLNIIASIASGFLPYELIMLLFYSSILSLDFIALLGLYVLVCYWMVSKSDNPVMLVTIFGLIVIPMKLFIIDPRINVPYPLMIYIMDFLLLTSIILSGFFAKQFRAYMKKLCFDIKQSLKR
ncbi:MAG: hypothetical protein AB7V50_04110 [Vampirovibrionia bacterium]